MVRPAFLLALAGVLPACGGSGSSSDGANAAPALVLLTPAGTQLRTVVVEYQLSDLESDPASLVVEYSTDGGTSWAPATRSTAPFNLGDGVSGLATSPTPVTRSFYWSSHLDGVALGAQETDVRLRITATAGGNGSPVMTGLFTVSNAPDQVVGIAASALPWSGAETTQETVTGNHVADAMRTENGTQLAIVNIGAIRAGLPSSYLPGNLALRRPAAGYAAGPPYDLVLEDVARMVPFEDRIVTRTVTGAQLWAALEHSVGLVYPPGTLPFLQISGFTFSYSLSAPAGSRVLAVAMDGGVPIAADATVYSVAIPDFLNVGEDGYAMFADGLGTPGRFMMGDVLARIQTQGTITAPALGRITLFP